MATAPTCCYDARMQPVAVGVDNSLGVTAVTLRPPVALVSAQQLLAANLTTMEGPVPQPMPPHKDKVHQFRDESMMLQTGLARYFNEPLFSDLVVVAPDGRKLHCHQLILSAGSKRFAAMLEEGNLAGEELPVWGVDSAALESVLQFFYTGECLFTYENMVPVLDASQRLEVKPLSAAADAFISSMIFPYTVTTVLRQAVAFKIDELVNNCLSYITGRLEEVAGTDDFLTANHTVLIKVLTAAKGHYPEMILFKAAWTWVCSDIQNVQHLEAIMRLVKIPDISFDDLLALGGAKGVTLPPNLGLVLGEGAQQPREGGEGGLSMSQLQAAAMGNATALASAAAAAAEAAAVGDAGSGGEGGSASGGGGGGSGQGRPSHRGVCQVEGCWADLRNLRDYHLRYKICEYHLKVPSIIRDGKPQRFCQQCGRFQPLSDFDQNKRSCRARLEKHNARRRKRGDEEGLGPDQADGFPDLLGPPAVGNPYAPVRPGPYHSNKRSRALVHASDDDAFFPEAHLPPYGSLQQLSAAMAAGGPGDLQGVANGLLQVGMQSGMLWQQQSAAGSGSLGGASRYGGAGGGMTPGVLSPVEAAAAAAAAAEAAAAADAASRQQYRHPRSHPGTQQSPPNSAGAGPQPAAPAPPAAAAAVALEGLQAPHDMALMEAQANAAVVDAMRAAVVDPAAVTSPTPLEGPVGLRALVGDVAASSTPAAAASKEQPAAA